MSFGKDKNFCALTILLWGSDGVGKTPTVLELARHAGPCAAIDADGGLIPYVKEDDDFIDYLQTDDPLVVRKELEKLCKDPGKYKMFAIDPLSTIYSKAQRLVEAHEKGKKHKQGQQVSEFETALTIRSWGPIKSLNEDIMRFIRSAGMPVICTSREDNVWKDSKIVDLRPAGDKKAPHEFTLNIHLTQPVPGGPRFATVKRDRLRRMPDRLEYAHNDPLALARKILEVYPEYFGGQPVPVERASEEVQQEINYYIGELYPGRYDELVTRIRNRYKCDGVENLNPTSAGEVLSSLREQWQKKQSDASEALTTNDNDNDHKE